MTDGVLWINKNGVSIKQFISEAATIPGELIIINSEVRTLPRETAGHEAFHFWYGTKARGDYVEVLQDNLDYSSQAFRDYQDSFVRHYFDGAVDVSDFKQLRLFQEELFAYISGDIHEGRHEDVLRRMLRDYDAVKAAWEALVREQQSQTATRQIEDETQFMAESQPLVERIRKAREDAMVEQLQAEYAEGFADYEAKQRQNQTVQLKGEESAEPGKPKGKTELTKSTTRDTLQKKQGGKGRRKFQSEELFAKHYGKHSGEFGEISLEEYQSRANELADSPLSDDVVELTRSDGSVAKYRFSTNEFVAINADGTIRTFFKPTKGRRYWQDELDRN